MFTNKLYIGCKLDSSGNVDSATAAHNTIMREIHFYKGKQSPQTYDSSAPVDSAGTELWSCEAD